MTIAPSGPTRVVIFHRGEYFYPLELPHDEDLAPHAAANPGTTKISDALTGDVLWLSPEKMN